MLFRSREILPDVDLLKISEEEADMLGGEALSLIHILKSTVTSVTTQPQPNTVSPLRRGRRPRLKQNPERRIKVQIESVTKVDGTGSPTAQPFTEIRRNNVYQLSLIHI